MTTLRRLIVTPLLIGAVWLLATAAPGAGQSSPGGSVSPESTPGGTVSPEPTPGGTPVPTPAGPKVPDPRQTTMAFTSGRLCAAETGRCNRDVFSDDPGSDAAPKALVPFPGVDDDPSLSPDGRHIVFSSDRVCDPDGDGENAPGCQQNRDLYIMDTDGTDLRRFTNHPRPDQRPDWSPLGDSIVWHREIPGSNGKSEIISKSFDSDPDAEFEFQLTEGDRDFQPVWSPSGHQVAFTRVNLPDEPPTDASGADLQAIAANIYVYDFCVDDGPRVSGPYGDQLQHPDFDQAPAWRPDPDALAQSNPCEWDWRTEGEIAFGSLRDCANPAAALVDQSAANCSYDLYRMPVGANGPMFRQQQQEESGVTRLTADANCVAGSAPPPGTSGCPQDLDPTYSPDGTQLAFWSDRPEPEQGDRPGARLYASAIPVTAPMRAVTRYLRRAQTRAEPFPPAGDLQNAEDNDVYLIDAQAGAVAGLTNLTPDGNNGTAGKFDDMAPSWTFRGTRGGGGNGGVQIPTPAAQVVQVDVVKFRDVNGNGRRESGEGPLSGVRFFGDINRNGTADPGEPTAITDGDGRAAMSLLRADPEVRITEIKPDGFVCTTPSPCFHDVKTASAPRQVLFGNAPTAVVAEDRCLLTAGLGRVGVAPRRGGRLKVQFKRRAAGPASVRIFQVSSARTVLGRRLVASFRNKKRSFTWSGKDTRGRFVSDGYFVAIYKARGDGRTDVRRVAFRRVRGRFSKRPPYARRTICRTVRLLTLSGPAFGGSRLEPLRLRFRLNQAADVRVVIRRGTEVVKRFAVSPAEPDRIYRRALKAEGAPRGNYRVSLIATSPGEKTQQIRLHSRRL